MLNRAYPGQECSIARALEVVGERWTLLILRDAVLGMERFDDFQRSLGIATNVLTSRLRLLVDEGLLERVPDERRGGRHRYALTDKGRGLAPAIIALMKWGDRFYAGPEGPPRLTLHRDCGGSLDEGLVCSACGERAGIGEIDLPARAAAPSA